MKLSDFIKPISENGSIFKEFTKEEISDIRQIPNIKNKVIAVLKLIYDPEISVNIWDLGLIYNVTIDDSNNVNIKMTLTSPTCPVAEAIPQEVKKKIIQVITEIKLVNVELVWKPAWNKSMMNNDARFILDMM